MKKRQDVRLVKIDIKNWSSPVSREFGIRQIPTLWLYQGRDRRSTSVPQVLATLQQEG